MDLFTYLMAKNGNNSSVHGDLFSYLLGKGQSQTQTISGVTIYIPNAKKLVSFMMTKESTQEGTPTPDNPVEVETVKGSVDVKVVGKNLLNYNSSYIKRNDFVSVSINNNNIELNNSFSGGNTGIAYFIPVEVGKTITISYDNISDISAVNNRIQYEFYDEPLTSITSLPGTIINRNNKYITTTATKAYLMVLIRVDNGSGYVLSDLMVSYQDDKVYELYKESIVPIPLNNNKIVGIGNYKDELIVDKNGNVFINKKIGKFNFNGSENWVLSGNQPVNGIKFYYSRRYNNIISGQDNTNVTLCNYFKAITLGDYNDANSTGICMFRGLGGGGIDVCILNTSMTLNDFKSLLANNNMYIYQALQTPQLIDLNTTVDINLFKGVNNITNSEDGYMTIEYH